MRWSLILLALLLTTPAWGRSKVELPGGAMDEWEGLVVKNWDCGDSLIDSRTKKGGVAACLRSMVLDPVSGRSTVLVDVRIDHDDGLDAAELEWTLRLDAGRIDRHLSGFQVAARHGHEGEATLPVLPAAQTIATQPEAVIAGLKPQERQQLHSTLAWEFQTWDPSIGLKFINLKLQGGGVGGTYR